MNIKFKAKLKGSNEMMYMGCDKFPVLLAVGITPTGKRVIWFLTSKSSLVSYAEIGKDCEIYEDL